MPGLKTSARVGLSLGAAAFLLVFVMSVGGVEAGDVVATARKLSWRGALLAVLVYVALHALRTLRLWLLLPRSARPSYVSLLFVCAAYTMANILLPAKLGEATLVVYLKTVCRVPASYGLSALVVARLLDLATLSLSFSLACLSLALAGAYPDIEWFLPVAGLLAAGSLVFFFLSVRLDLCFALVSRLSRALSIDRWRIVGRVLELFDRAARSAREANGKKALVLASGVSVLMWVAIFVFYGALALDLGLPAETTLTEAVFGSSVAILTSLLPISAFASFGTMESGWVLGFHLLGVDKKVAALTGLGVHVVQLVVVVFFGLLGHLGMALVSRRDET